MIDARISTDADTACLVEKVGNVVRKIMSNPPFDTSHDYTHIERVVSLAHKLLDDEKQRHPDRNHDRLLVTLTAMLHDISDSKYIIPPAVNSDDRPAAVNAAEGILLEGGAAPKLASTVQLLASHVSCSFELRNPGIIDDLVARYPELAIVSDADRLDALGGMGIARAFTFGGAHGRTVDETREVFESKLLMRERLMRTQKGKLMAAERCQRMRQWMDWWDAELNELAA